MLKLSDSEVDKLKSAAKNATDVTSTLSSNMIGNSNDETNFLYKLLLTNRQVANLRNVFANNLSANIKVSKTQVPKTTQSCGFLRRLLEPLMKVGLPLMKNGLKPLAKSILMASGLTAAASAADAGIHLKFSVREQKQ